MSRYRPLRMTLIRMGLLALTAYISIPSQSNATIISFPFPTLLNILLPDSIAIIAGNSTDGANFFEIYH